MKTNPGGEIAPENVIGRDAFIRNLWEALERQSVVLSSERRMGKTSVLKKMRVENTGRYQVIYMDVEGFETPLDFVGNVLHNAQSNLGWFQWGRSKVGGLLQKIAGMEIGGFVRLPEDLSPHWRNLLEAIVADLGQKPEQPVVFFWDEMPLMLYKIRHRSGERAAMEVLDVLRSLRQTYSGIRMVYTGSIGLHHVLSELRTAGYANDATNDMLGIELPPLDNAGARHLAKELIIGENLPCAEPDLVTEVLAAETDCIPFYIHHVVAALKRRGAAADEAQVRAVINTFLIDAQDPWHFSHYRKRIEEYYGQEQAPVVLFLLDELAAAETPMRVDRLHVLFLSRFERGTNETINRVLGGDREPLLHLLRLLQCDHYVAKTPEDGSYAFRFPLICRWWRLERNL